MRKYQKPSVKMLSLNASVAIMTGSASFMELDERGVYDVYAPVANFD